MKTFFKIAILLLVTPSLRAQLFIQNGAALRSTGAAVITLENTDLINDGIIAQAMGGTFIFSGGNSNKIAQLGASYSEPTFDTLVVAKTGSGQLALQETVQVNGAVKFTTGLIDLTSSIIRLAPSALLLGENETSRTVSTPLPGLNGGYISITRNLNAPSAVNPGNLGAVLTSAQNLGNTTIKRGHAAQVNGSGSGSSIKRYYDITPANNAGLNATFRLRYFDAELNGLMENDLNQWKSVDNTTWTNEGYTSRDVSTNYVEKTGIIDFSRWTLSTSNNPLPLLLTAFEMGCVAGKVNLNWTTEQERNVDHFEIQYSENAREWETIAFVPFIATTHDYHYTSERANGYYRLAVTDQDGTRTYSEVKNISCASSTSSIVLWPNPTTEQVFIGLNMASASMMSIAVYDAKGRAILQQVAQLNEGDNKVTLKLNRFAAGVYWIKMDWNNGATHKSLKVVKQ